MLVGALAIITLVLVKGDICPGQRGRLHKLLPAIAALWLACALFAIESLAIAGGIVYFYSQVETKKTRQIGPLWLLYGVNGLGLFSVMVNSFQLGGVALVMQQILWGAVSGALFAHLLLIQARSRLQAFHRILPAFGIVSLMVLVIALAMQAWGLGETVVNEKIVQLGLGFVLSIGAALIWCWHIVRQVTVNKLMVAAAMVLMFGANTALLPLFAFTV
ncbi:hypothetical protein J4N39_08640 [Vibrio sp. SCSIO 43136]|nr:hypothetical protein J4N39_08640 [Vibrio sp. SCSIO 43136]